MLRVWRALAQPSAASQPRARAACHPEREQPQSIENQTTDVDLDRDEQTADQRDEAGRNPIGARHSRLPTSVIRRSANSPHGVFVNTRASDGLYGNGSEHDYRLEVLGLITHLNDLGRNAWRRPGFRRECGPDDLIAYFRRGRSTI